MAMKAMGCFASDLASLPAEAVTCISDKWCQEAQQSYCCNAAEKKALVLNWEYMLSKHPPSLK